MSDRTPDTRHLTEEEILQAEIEAWTSIYRSAQSQMAVARRELEKRGKKIKPVPFYEIVDFSCERR